MAPLPIPGENSPERVRVFSHGRGHRCWWMLMVFLYQVYEACKGLQHSLAHDPHPPSSQPQHRISLTHFVGPLWLWLNHLANPSFSYLHFICNLNSPLPCKVTYKFQGFEPGHFQGPLFCLPKTWWSLRGSQQLLSLCDVGLYIWSSFGLSKVMAAAGDTWGNGGHTDTEPPDSS